MHPQTINSKLFHRKILYKLLLPEALFLSSKCTTNRLAAGLRRGPAGRAYSVPPDPLAGLRDGAGPPEERGGEKGQERSEGEGRGKGKEGGKRRSRKRGIRDREGEGRGKRG